MNAAFQEFERKYANASREPTLTVTVRGTLNLNEAALTALGHPQGVILMYDRDEAIIGLRPASREDPNAYAVTRLGTSEKSRTIVAKEFCAWIGADLTEARRYPMTIEDGIGCVNLRGPVRVVTGGPRGRRKATS